MKRNTNYSRSHFITTLSNRNLDNTHFSKTCKTKLIKSLRYYNDEKFKGKGSLSDFSFFELASYSISPLGNGTEELFNNHLSYIGYGINNKSNRVDIEQFDIQFEFNDDSNIDEMMKKWFSFHYSKVEKQIKKRFENFIEYTNSVPIKDDKIVVSIEWEDMNYNWGADEMRKKYIEKGISKNWSYSDISFYLKVEERIICSDYVLYKMKFDSWL